MSPSSADVYDKRSNEIMNWNRLTNANNHTPFWRKGFKHVHRAVDPNNRHADASYPSQKCVSYEWVHW